MNRPSKISRHWLLALAVIAAIGLPGCSRITKENYEKLKMGMSYAEVVALLGEPEKCESLLAVKTCTWGKAPKTVTVRLVADNVIFFENEGL